MTSKSVTNMDGVMAGFVASGTGKVANVSTVTESFSSVMQKTTNQNTEWDSTEFMSANSKKTEVPTSTNVVKENTQTAKQPEKDVQTGTERPTEEAVENAKDAVQETAEKVVKKVADTLGISEEEVEQAMETLGLTAINLLDSANLTQLMLNLSGETDMIALTTNETLYMGIKDIMQFVQEELAAIQEMSGLNEAQMNGCMEALNAEEMQQLFEETAETDVTETTPVFDMRETGVEMTEQPEEAVVTLPKNGEEVQVTLETDTKTGESAGDETFQNGNAILQDLTKNQSATTSVNNTQAAFTETQVQDIMDQIMDYMKVQVKADTTKLEMQLHPESLGTLNIHISSKDGVLTAQFTTQNEVVKSMIESQLITLQQSLNEQGVKVEAVEVNVATQQFDRNLNQGQGNEEKQAAEVKKKGPRRINLNDLAALEEEELEEADKVTADMMARNGNTVDYLA